MQLIGIVSKTAPHFVRTIKPNNEKRSNYFDDNVAMRQLRYSGLLEAVRVRAAGFSYRPTFEECYKRFHILAKGMTAYVSSNPRKDCERLFDNLKLNKSRVQFGTTKLFMKEAEVILFRIKSK